MLLLTTCNTAVKHTYKKPITRRHTFAIQESAFPFNHSLGICKLDKTPGPEGLILATSFTYDIFFLLFKLTFFIHEPHCFNGHRLQENESLLHAVTANPIYPTNK